MDYTRKEGPALGRRPYKERKTKTFQKENKAKKTKRSQEARAGEDNLVSLSMVHILWDPLEPGFSCGAAGRLDLFREVQRRTKGGGLRLSQLLWGRPTGFTLQWGRGGCGASSSQAGG